MPWNSTWPVGNISVKANRVIGQQNTTYIETTMGNSVVGTNTNTTRDHFWNVGTDEDGRHRFVQSPAFTVGGVPTDPVVGSGMNGVLYLKTTNNVANWFHRPSSGNIYQATPTLLQGSTSLPSSSSYTNVVTVPANVYGEIFMYCPTQFDDDGGQWGFFCSNGSIVQSWALTNLVQGSGSDSSALKFANGSDASGFNIRARRSQASSSQTAWNYRIIYRAL